MVDDVTGALVVENLRRAGDLVREAAQMIRPTARTPEDAVDMVVYLWFAAVLPRDAAKEFNRLGGSCYERFRDALMRSLEEK